MLNITDEEFLETSDTYFDLLLTDGGDLALDENKNLTIISGNELKRQNARNVIKSITVNWFYDHIGADLEQLYGAHIEYAVSKGLTLIQEGLLLHGLFTLGEVFIKAVNQSKYEVIFIVILQLGDEIIPMDVVLDITGRVAINWGDFDEGIKKQKHGRA